MLCNVYNDFMLEMHIKLYLTNSYKNHLLQQILSLFSSSLILS